MYLPCGRPSIAQTLWILAFSATLIGGVLALRLWDLGLVERCAIVLVPLATGIGYIRAMVADMRRMDELQQRIWLEAVGIAFAAGMFLLLIEPVLNRAGLREHLTGARIAAIMLLLVLGAEVVIARRYR